MHKKFDLICHIIAEQSKNKLKARYVMRDAILCCSAIQLFTSLVFIFIHARSRRSFGFIIPAVLVYRKEFVSCFWVDRRNKGVWQSSRQVQKFSIWHFHEYLSGKDVFQMYIAHILWLDLSFLRDISFSNGQREFSQLLYLTVFVIIFVIVVIWFILYRECKTTSNPE